MQTKILSRPARTPKEIAQRLFNLSRQLERKAVKGEPLNMKELRYVSKKLETYAVRLAALSSLDAQINLY